jgi:D-amino peptidase
MKVFIMTDLEGVAGILDFAEWADFGSRYFDRAKMLLTEEVNAAVKGFFSAGADEIIVCDGHGDHGIDPIMLDRRVQLIDGSLSRWPFYLDESYNVLAWVGQHAKAGTPFAHMAHTWNLSVVDYRINDISVGELGIMAMIGATFGVTPIFCSGDRALSLEALELLPGIESVEVKRGLVYGSGDECDHDTYRIRNSDALHLHPEVARGLIMDGAERALRRYIVEPGSFTQMKTEPPYRKEVRYRADGKHAAWIGFAEHPTDLIACANMEEAPLQ